MLKSFLVSIFLFLTTFSTTTTAFLSRPSVEDLWNNGATLSLYQTYTHNNPDWQLGSEAGVHIEVFGGKWYLFNRKIVWQNTPSFCANKQLMQIEVRESSDKGKTWTSPVVIIDNIPGSPWECAATDGDIIFNAQTGIWHYLFQCLDRNGVWNGCHLTHKGPTPIGNYSNDSSNNPVINSGEIWGAICTNQEADCARIARTSPYGKILDEGTFDIVELRNDYYFVTFHGYDGINGYRSIAKTKDFDNWEVIINDAILDRYDALKINIDWATTGPIGFGSARTIKYNGYYYTLSEAADMNLACIHGQQWISVLHRSKTIKMTEAEMIPSGKPIFTKDSFPRKDPNPLPCNPAYAGIFQDSDGTFYVHVSRSSNSATLGGIYLYKVTRNL